MQKIRWIHFSDLHLGNEDAVETVLMRKKLPKYIESLNTSFDYAFCTGDVKEWSSDFSEVPAYLTRILKASKTPFDHFFIVPGNHDVKVSGETFSQDRDELISRLTNCDTNDYQSQVGVIRKEDLKLLRAGEREFIDFVGTFLGSDRADLYKAAPHFVITTDDFNVLHVDTTLTYTTGHTTNLIIGTKLLMNALESCDSSKPTILLTHYPYADLEMQERNEVEALLNEYHVQLWMAGHEHENQIHYEREKFFEVQCGNVEFQNGARSCFLIGEYDIDTGNTVITVHAWYPLKGWELYPFARTGTEDNSCFPFDWRLPGDERAEDVSLELSNAREANERLSEAGNIFSDVKINPTILTDLEWAGQTYQNRDGRSSLDEILAGLWLEKERANISCNALILGDGGTGKSTAMYYECCRLLENHRLAVYISLQARENTEFESLKEYILRSLYKDIDDRSWGKFIKLVCSRHTHPDLVLFIDGFNELSGEGATKYVSEIKELAGFAGVQIIVSSRLDFLRDFGLRSFGMIHTCNLREAQIQSLFVGRETDWQNVLAYKNLRILLKNPLMALLYAATCPVVERSEALDYLEWITPISNASDLLHDYYMSQIAILLERDSVDGKRIFNSLVAISRVLPEIAYLAEKGNTTILKEDDFDQFLRKSVESFNRNQSSAMRLKRVQRRFRIHEHKVSEADIYDLIITELCLLKSGTGTVSFPHQVFRDYLAAVYLHNSLVENFSVDTLWHDQDINKGVVQYLRYIGNKPAWGAGGVATQMLHPYRGQEADGKDHFVSNVINCWLSVGDGERDLSGLDLRNISLSDHLKAEFRGTININEAWISKETLINNRCHDRIVNIAFSHDNHTMAAISQNGIVSITNLITMSQMIVGELTGNSHQANIGFDGDDCLIVKNEAGTYKWPTIAYDKIETGDETAIITVPVMEEEAANKIHALKELLRNSDLEGVCSRVSENGKYLAVGFESGFIQIWNVEEKNCIAGLSLSVGQIATASFTKDGKIAALGAGGKIVQLWDTSNNRCIKTLFFDQRVSKVRFPSDERYLECQFSNGAYKRVDLTSGEISATKRPELNPFRSKAFQDAVSNFSIADVKAAPDGNAIVLTSSGKAYTWDEKRRRLSFCDKHGAKVTAIAVCTSDTRFAASYSPENYVATRDDKGRRELLNGKKLVRVRIIKTGQCQWRLPTKGRAIRKLQFFTTNRIILAGFATNGDILLWELINEPAAWGEKGHWETVDIVRNNQAEPLECAVPSSKKYFICAYDDGSMNIRSFSNTGNSRIIRTLPGIDADAFRWMTIKCDSELRTKLAGYRHC